MNVICWRGQRGKGLSIKRKRKEKKGRVNFWKGARAGLRHPEKEKKANAHKRCRLRQTGLK